MRQPGRQRAPPGAARDDGVSAYVIHTLDSLDIGPLGAGCTVVMYGCTHEPAVERGEWYINPGSAGPPRFSLPRTVARVHRCLLRLRAEIVQ